MKKINKVLFWIFTALVMAGCSDSDVKDPKLVFIGDSLVANWDLQESFPSQMTVNKGFCGSGLDYLQSFAGKMTGCDVVILSGTNDCSWLKPDQFVGYADDYVSALMAMGARKYYVYSILPRDYEKFGEDVYRAITTINPLIQARLEKLPNVVYINVYEDMLYKNNLNPNLALDGLHLNGYGYEILAAALVDKF